MSIVNLTASVTIPNLSAEPSPDSDPQTGEPLATVFRGRSPVTGRSFRAVYIHPTPDNPDQRGRLTLDRIEGHNISRYDLSYIDPPGVRRMMENIPANLETLHRELTLIMTQWLLLPLGEHVRVEIGELPPNAQKALDRLDR
jgi:hypothetical protein